MHTCSKYMMYVSYSKVSPRLVEIIYLYIYLIASYFFLFFANMNKTQRDTAARLIPFIAENWRQPALHDRELVLLPCGVAFDLILANLPYSKILRLRMGENERRD